MLLEKYKEAKLFFNANFLEKTSKTGLSGYRGELILIPGEAGDALGHAKPPKDLMRGVVLLADDQLKMVVGSLDDIASLSTFVEKYKDDFAPDMKALIYVVNIKSPATVEMFGINFVLIPMVQGIPWNEVVEELRLEKSDFKGQTPADKIVTVYNEMRDYKAGGPAATLDEVMANTTDTVREAWGAV